MCTVFKDKLGILASSPLRGIQVNKLTRKSQMEGDFFNMLLPSRYIEKNQMTILEEVVVIDFADESWN